VEAICEQIQAVAPDLNKHRGGYMRIVEVQWEDACSNSGYYRKDKPDEEHKATICKTVGYLKRKNQKHIILVTEYFDDGESRHVHTIPRKVVKGITYLK